MKKAKRVLRRTCNNCGYCGDNRAVPTGAPQLRCLNSFSPKCQRKDYTPLTKEEMKKGCEHHKTHEEREAASRLSDEQLRNHDMSH